MPRTTRRAFLATAAAGVILTSSRAETAAKRVLVVVGPSSHPPGTHEVAAGARLLKHCLEDKSVNLGLSVEVSTGWPATNEAKSKADTVVFIGDHFPPMKLPEPKKILGELGVMMNRGCGIVCVHYATGLRAEDVAEDGDHPLLHWMGGYFATKCKHHQSVAKLFTSKITPDDQSHDVMRGVKEFTFDDEPYYNNYFGKSGFLPGVKSLATTVPPGEGMKKETVVWSIDRKDGGRGVGIVMPHFYKNWKQPDFRTMVLNAVAWTAKVTVPAKGVAVELPDLTSFKPDSVEPQPRKK